MEDHGKCGLLHHGMAWQEYAAQHTVKEAINANYTSHYGM